MRRQPALKEIHAVHDDSKTLRSADRHVEAISVKEGRRYGSGA
jgi:hypothetical protein